MNKLDRIRWACSVRHICVCASLKHIYRGFIFNLHEQKNELYKQILYLFTKRRGSFRRKWPISVGDRHLRCIYRLRPQKINFFPNNWFLTKVRSLDWARWGVRWGRVRLNEAEWSQMRPGESRWGSHVTTKSIQKGALSCFYGASERGEQAEDRLPNSSYSGYNLFANWSSAISCSLAQSATNCNPVWWTPRIRESNKNKRVRRCKRMLPITRRLKTAFRERKKLVLLFMVSKLSLISL